MGLRQKSQQKIFGIGTNNPSGRHGISVPSGATHGIHAAALGTGYGIYGYCVGSHGIYGQSDAVGGVAVFGNAGNTGSLGGYFTGVSAGLFAQAISPQYHAYIGHASGWALHGDNANTYIAGTYQGSDERLKEDIHSMDMAGALGKLLALRPVSFKWKPDAAQSLAQKGIQHGVIAQEAIEVMPELVLLTETPTPPPGAVPKGSP